MIKTVEASEIPEDARVLEWSMRDGKRVCKVEIPDVSRETQPELPPIVEDDATEAGEDEAEEG